MGTQHRAAHCRQLAWDQAAEKLLPITTAGVHLSGSRGAVAQLLGQRKCSAATPPTSPPVRAARTRVGF